jgi:hypothetical protein
MKSLCAEYHRKVKTKPQNKIKMLICLVKYLEYTEQGGESEQWNFLIALLKDQMQNPGDFKK